MRHEEEKNADSRVSTHVHAPSDVGFIHTEQGQFTYFSGSAGGAKTTFGMSAVDLAKVISATSDKILHAELGNSATEREVLNKLVAMREFCEHRAAALGKNEIYQNAAEMTDSLLGSGHIPLILSGIAPASQYEIAVRSVSSYDLHVYFDLFPAAAVQAKEYLVKQDLMKSVADFRQMVVRMRYTQQSESPGFYFCNRILAVIDDSIIKANQKTMPKECAQMDLCHTLQATVAKLINEIDESIVGEELILNLTLCLSNVERQNTVEYQKKISDALYDVLGKFADKLGFSGEGDIEVTDEQDKILQDILPLIAYLNSTRNPFARDGLYGKLETNAFHEAALVEYKKHESKELSRPFVFNYAHEKAKKEEYNGDQIEKLLYGSANEQVKEASAVSGFFSSMSNALKSITSDSSASSSSIQSQSEQRRQRLALPVPKQYLLLEAPKDAVKEFNRPGNSK
jgi:hypothetical protein